MKVVSESIQLANQFEDLCYDIFKAYNYEVQKSLDVSSINGKTPERIDIDLLVKDNQNMKKAIIELKLYRSKNISLDLVKKGIIHLQSLSEKIKADGFVLIVSNSLSKEVIDKLEQEYGVIIWDKHDLHALTKNFVELHERLLELLRKSNQIPGRTQQLFRKNDTVIEEIWQSNISKRILKSTTNIEYYSELKKIPPGREGWRDFEEVCYKI
ncbi:restriction endonuclease [Sporohalobacter salinus]|uniref:restriction endonuclease n=1 Tax=Sporohalobacter salinus TaxID=1494606 RepID=UPI00195F4B08|nr:transposase-like protein [Sporohalobacter salinus]